MARSTVSMFIDIDLGEVLAEMSDQQLIDALESRCIKIARTTEEAKIDTFTPLVEEAADMLRQGRADDALLTLERALSPKWKSPEEPAGRIRHMQWERQANG
jgi:hypothetical protein